MAKVIVERPRYGSRSKGAAKGYQRRLQKLGDDAPIREGIKARHNGGSKMLNEHLGPLKRFLYSNVGRPWDKVFAEICAHINRNSAVQDHVRDHVDDFVERNVIVIDGKLCSGEPGWRYGQPFGARWFRGSGREQLYVCPWSGLLKLFKPRRKPKTKAPWTIIKLDQERSYRLIKGIWYEVMRQVRCVKDHWTGKMVPIVTETKAQLNKRELKRLYHNYPRAQRAGSDDGGATR